MMIIMIIVKIIYIPASSKGSKISAPTSRIDPEVLGSEIHPRVCFLFFNKSHWFLIHLPSCCCQSIVILLNWSTLFVCFRHWF